LQKNLLPDSPFSPALNNTHRRENHTHMHMLFHVSSTETNTTKPPALQKVQAVFLWWKL